MSSNIDVREQGNKVFLITGASTGIGEATARRAVEAGFRVVLAARSTEKLERLQAELGNQSALAVTCDVSSWQSQQNLVQQTINHFGRIDVVFANAGFSSGPTFYGGEEKPDEWKEMVLMACKIYANNKLRKILFQEQFLFFATSEDMLLKCYGTMVKDFCSALNDYLEADLVGGQPIMHNNFILRWLKRLKCYYIMVTHQNPIFNLCGSLLIKQP